jgi:hypothetical protein
VGGFGDIGRALDQAEIGHRIGHAPARKSSRQYSSSLLNSGTQVAMDLPNSRRTWP